jgi:hypothetical protein
MFKQLTERLNIWWEDHEYPVYFYERFESVIVNHFDRFLGALYWGHHGELLIMVPQSDIGTTVAVHVKRVCAACLPPTDVRSVYAPSTPPLPNPVISDH